MGGYCGRHRSPAVPYRITAPIVGFGGVHALRVHVVMKYFDARKCGMQYIIITLPDLSCHPKMIENRILDSEHTTT